MDGLDPVKQEALSGERALRGRLRRRGLGGAVALSSLAVVAILWQLHPPAGDLPARSPALPSPPRLIAAAAAPNELAPAPGLADEIPLMQAGPSDDAKHGPRHPHPITPTRLRIYRENNLIGAMNRAMDLGRHQELRKLNAQYRDEYPEDEHQLQRAYELVADCQEELTDERQAHAREFWKKYRSSQLRRFVRRHCRL
ncbi:MAG TPA: hypothetical protein VFU02_08705 [Polyangiaceae bacterium]|nr:hypothetical protein [Polyangiaceae bacterium]